jgi:hypothetical protein
MIFEILTSVNIKVTTPEPFRRGSLVGRYQCLRETCHIRLREASDTYEPGVLNSIDSHIVSTHSPNNGSVRFEFPTVDAVTISIYWYVTPCTLLVVWKMEAVRSSETSVSTIL